MEATGSDQLKNEYNDSNMTPELMNQLSGQPFHKFDEWWKDFDQVYNKKTKAQGRWNIYCQHGGEPTRKFKSIAVRNSDKCECPFSVTVYNKDGKVGWAKNPSLKHVHVLKDKSRMASVDPNMFIDMPDIEVFLIAHQSLPH